MTSTSKKDKLSELDLMKAEHTAKLNPAAAKPLAPPVISIKVELTDREGVTNRCDLPARVLNRDDMLDVYRLAALYSGIEFDSLPSYAQEVCLAQSMIEIMWKNEVPEWLKLAMAENEDVSLQIGRAINNHRNAWFRGDYREGNAGKKAPGLVVTPVLPASPGTK